MQKVIKLDIRKNGCAMHKRLKPNNYDHTNIDGSFRILTNMPVPGRIALQIRGPKWYTHSSMSREVAEELIEALCNALEESN